MLSLRTFSPAMLAWAAVAMTKTMRGFRNHLRRDGKFDGASFDCERLCVDQGIGDFFVCRFEDSAEGLSGDVHFFGGLLLIEALEVSEANCLKLIHGQGDMLQEGKRDASWFVEGGLRQVAYASAMSWSGHIGSPVFACGLNGRRYFAPFATGQLNTAELTAEGYYQLRQR